MLGSRLNTDRRRSLPAGTGGQRGHVQLGSRHCRGRELWPFEISPILVRAHRLGPGCSHVALPLPIFRGRGRVQRGIVTERRGRRVLKAGRVMTGCVANMATGQGALYSDQVRPALLESHNTVQAETRVGSHPPYDNFAPRAAPDVAELCVTASLRPIWPGRQDLISWQGVGCWQLAIRDIHVQHGRTAPHTVPCAAPHKLPLPLYQQPSKAACPGRPIAAHPFFDAIERTRYEY